MRRALADARSADSGDAAPLGGEKLCAELGWCALPDTTLASVCADSTEYPDSDHAQQDWTDQVIGCDALIAASSPGLAYDTTAADELSRAPDRDGR